MQRLDTRERRERGVHVVARSRAEEPDRPGDTGVHGPAVGGPAHISGPACRSGREETVSRLPALHIKDAGLRP